MSAEISQIKSDERSNKPAAEAGAPADEILRRRFETLRWRLKAGLLLAFLTPLAALSIYFHFQFDRSLKGSGKRHLVALAESQRNTIDLFLQERVVNIFSVFRSREFSLNPSPEDMAGYLEGLRQASDAFIDVGFFGADGVQSGYAGPFAYLHGKDYSREGWFTTLMQQERDYYISDVYLGFRNRPHFSIAVRQRFDGQPCIVRATLDPARFYHFLTTIHREKGIDSALVNQEGAYQAVDPEHGTVLSLCGLLPAGQADAGVEEVAEGGHSVLVGYARLRETPWILMVRQPLSVAYEQMYRARTIMIAATAALTVIVVASIWWGVDNFIQRARAGARAKEELRYQLLHASKLASIGELAAGVAHEINNPLAIIVAETGVIRDMLDPAFGLDSSPEKIRAELDHLDAAVFRARGITRKLLDLSRKHEPRLAPCDVNLLLDDVVQGLKEREFAVSNVELVRDYDPALPEVLLDADQLSQVFLNIINNAGDAINGHGTITLSTRSHDGFVRVAVTDTGAGMPPELMEKIFLPFFTTKETGKGTGLGLSISLSIVEGMGGRLHVQSVPGAGSSFMIDLPIEQSPGGKGGHV